MMEDVKRLSPVNVRFGMLAFLLIAMGGNRRRVPIGSAQERGRPLQR